MARIGKVDPKFKRLDEARADLLRNLRGIGAHEAMLAAIERFIEAKLATMSI